jgi:hypothetical protein
MQNSKCKVQNCGVSFGNRIKFIGEADTIILHFAFCILHWAVSAAHRLKFTISYHNTAAMATVSAVRGKKCLTKGHFCSLITQTDNTKTDEAEVKLQAHPQRVLHS